MMKRLLLLVLWGVLAVPTLAAPRPPLPALCQGRDLNAAGFYDAANDHYNNGNYLQAARDYTCALALQPNMDRAVYWRALAYYYAESYDRALADLNNYLERVPDDNYAWVQRGLTHYLLGDFDRAIADFDQALTLNPSDGFAYNWRGWLHFMYGDLEMAISDYQQTIALSPDETIVHIDLAVTYAANDDVDEAIAEYRLAGEVDERYSFVYNGADDDLFDWYVQVYTEALDRWPGNFIALTFRGQSYARLGLFDEAIADFSEAISVAPDFPEPYAALGLVYDRLNDPDSALEQYLMYLELSDEPHPLIVSRAEFLQGE